MSTDPTRPTGPPAAASSGAPEQPAQPRERDGGRPEAEAADQAAADQSLPPTRVQPTVQPLPPTRAEPAVQPLPPTRAQPTFQPAQPRFEPAPPPRPTFQPATPAQAAQAGTPAQAPPVPFQAAGWPESGQGADRAAGQATEPPRGGLPRQPSRGAGQDAYPGYPDGAKPRRRRRRRRWMMALFALIVVLILLVIGDRVALAVAENDFADQAVANGMPVKPSVTIEGFPFLTQLAARDFHRVDISASNVPAGPIDITSVKATLNGMHLNSSFSGATVDHITATAFVSFAALAGGGGSTGGGITMTADGPDKVKITAGVGPLSDTEEAKITQTGPQTISIQVLNSGSPLGGLLSSFGSFSFNIPKLPVDVRITNVSVTPQGLTVSAAADHANLSKPSS
jgi:hypothetical protein